MCQIALARKIKLNHINITCVFYSTHTDILMRIIQHCQKHDLHSERLAIDRLKLSTVTQLK